MRLKLLLLAILAFSYDFGPGPGSTIENDLTIVWSCLANSLMAVLTPLAQFFATVITNIHCFVQNIQYIWLLFLKHSVCFFHNGGGVRQGYRCRKLFFVRNKSTAALVAFVLLSAAFVDIRVLSSTGDGF